MKKNRKLILLWVLVILWMIFIFILSSQTANESNGLSTAVTEKIVKVIEKAVPQNSIDIRTFNNVVRKNAHFFIFLILGILVSIALKDSGYSRKKRLVLAIIICFLYAVSDELHQMLVPGRGAQLKDVVIDSAGAIAGIALSFARKDAI